MTAQAAQGIGAPISAMGSLYQGNANASTSNYNATVAANNAITVEQQGAEAERRAQVQGSKTLGTMTAAYGASGVTGGSAIDVMRSSAANSELNALTIKNQADIKATALDNEAALDHYRANNDQISGQMGAFTSFIAGANNMVSQSGGGGSEESGDGAEGEEDDSAEGGADEEAAAAI